MKQNREKITRDLCKTRVLLFFPHSLGEADAIETALKTLGCEWTNTAAEVPREALVARAAEVGFLIIRQTIYIFGGENRREQIAHARLCTLEQLCEDYAPPVLQSQFNETSERLDKIEKHLNPDVDVKTTSFSANWPPGQSRP